VRLDEPDRVILLVEAVTLLALGSLLLGQAPTDLTQWVGGVAAVVGGYLLAAWYENRPVDD
jgi:hypothetical protein